MKKTYQVLAAIVLTIAVCLGIYYYSVPRMQAWVKDVGKDDQAKAVQKQEQQRSAITGTDPKERGDVR